MTKILILTNADVPEYIKGSTIHTISTGIIENNITLYSNSSLCEKTIKIKYEEIYDIGIEVDFILFFIVDPSNLKDANSSNNCKILKKLLDINRPEISIYIDYFEYSFSNKLLLNTFDYHRSDPFTYTFLKQYCKFYFKRECYPELFKEGYLPIQLFSPNKEYDVKEVYEKDIDIFCSFPQKFTGLRNNAINICKKLKEEGFNVVIKDDITSTEEFYNYIKRSCITIDAKGAGFQNIRFLEIIKYQSLCFREKYKIHYPNDFTNEMIVEYETENELYNKLKYYLHNKPLINKMINNSYEHFLKYHTPSKIVQYILSYFKPNVCLYGDSFVYEYTKKYFYNKLRSMNYPDLFVFSYDAQLYFNYEGNVKFYLIDSANNDCTIITNKEYYKDIISKTKNLNFLKIDYFSYDQIDDIKIISSTHCDKGLIEKLDINIQQEIYSKLFEDKVSLSSVFNFKKVKTTKDSVIFFIPSIIHIKNSSHVGKYTPEERIKQTLKQVKSIRNKVPNSVIILLEMSYLNLKELNILYEYVDHVCLYHNDTECEKHSSDINKNKGEIYVLKHIVELLYDNEIIFSHFLKFGGRYYLHENFLISNICKAIPSFKTYTNHNCILCDNQDIIIDPVLYSVPYNYLKNYLEIIIQCKNILNVKLTDVEHLLYKLFKINNIPFQVLDKLNICGNMGTSSEFHIF